MEPGRADGLDRGDPGPGGDPGWNGRPRPSRASGPSNALGSRNPRASRDPRMAGGGDPRWDAGPDPRVAGGGDRSWDAGVDSWPGQSRGPADETRLDLRVTGRPIPGRSRGADPYRNGAGPLGAAGADVRRDPGADPRRGFGSHADPGPGTDPGRRAGWSTEPDPGRRRAPTAGPAPSAPLPAPPAPALDEPASGSRRARHADPGRGPGPGARSGPVFGRETGTRPGSGPGQEGRFGPRADPKFGPRPWPEHPAEMRAGPDTATRPARPSTDPGSRTAGPPAAPRAPWAPGDDWPATGSGRRTAGRGGDALRSPAPDRRAGPQRGPRDSGPGSGRDLDGGRGRRSAPGPAAPPREFGLEEDGSGAVRSRRSKVQDRPVSQEPPDAEELDRRRSRAGRSAARGGRRRVRLILLALGLIVVLGAGAAAAVKLKLIPRSSGRSHELAVPLQLGSYVRRPQLEQQMNAKSLQQQVIAKSAGQASHVVSAVYENKAGVSGAAPPQIFLFIGGNLAGVSPAGFITSFTAQFKGAQATSAGSLGGQAACVDAQGSVAGGVALCTWADDDTFGVLTSPTMDLAELATQMRSIRPSVELPAK
jgi:hypothetical protein